MKIVLVLETWVGEEYRVKLWSIITDRSLRDGMTLRELVML